MKPSQALVVIPARLASTRLPRKLLLSETGKPLLQHTYEAACRSTLASGLLVAADHEEIAAAVHGFQGRVVMTSPACASGTDRVAEIALAHPQYDIFVNVQGDEPEISPAAIDLAIELLRNDPQAVMATLATPIRERARLEDPACVKVVFDENRRALYFSRAPIPFARTWNDALLHSEPANFHQHIGLYAYRREFLLQIAQLPQAAYEKIESLEQLRVLSAGYAIAVGVINEPTRGIDTPDDYRAFVARQTSTVAEEPLALIFDCDGTLTDSMPLHFLAWREVMARHGMIFEEDRFYSLGGMPTDKIIAMLAAEHGLTLDASAVAHEKEQAFLNQMHLLDEIPGVTSVVRQQRGRLKMAVASGGFRSIVLQQIQQIGLEGQFDTVVTAEDTERHKPEPDVFLEAARRLGVPPARCRVYEDSDLGIEAARRAGMSWVDVRTFHRPRRITPGFTKQSP